jgi:3-isopropylmalate dehydrogenase
LTNQHRIAVLPGDGIGPEVIREALKILQAVESRLPGSHFHCELFSVGAAEYLRSRDPMPEETFQQIKTYDVILLGAMGLPDVRWPSGQEMAPQLDLRERLELYCGLRPVCLYHENDTPLKGFRAGEIDFAIIRENTEGLFDSRKEIVDREADQVIDRLRITRGGAERVIRSAFRQAAKRKKKVTLVDKANVLPSMVFFRHIFDQISREFPGIETEKIYVDAATLYFLQRPQTFDVLVTENMFGDILSDLAAAIVGGMGMAPSGDIGDERAVFQPSHGSAPDIAGKGIANPAAAILSTAMMLRWLGEEKGAQMIYNAVSTVFQDPENRTRDLGGKLSTEVMGDKITSAIEQVAA